VKCRDALMALGREHAASEWSGHVNNPPRTADFKGWANIFADRLKPEGHVGRTSKQLSTRPEIGPSGYSVTATPPRSTPTW
jgi:hypothetical protein